MSAIVGHNRGPPVTHAHRHCLLHLKPSFREINTKMPTWKTFLMLNPHSLNPRLYLSPRTSRSSFVSNSLYPAIYQYSICSKINHPETQWFKTAVVCLAVTSKGQMRTSSCGLCLKGRLHFTLIPAEDGCAQR